VAFVKIVYQVPALTQVPAKHLKIQMVMHSVQLVLQAGLHLSLKQMAAWSVVFMAVLSNSLIVAPPLIISDCFLESFMESKSLLKSFEIFFSMFIELG